MGPLLKKNLKNIKVWKADKMHTVDVKQEKSFRRNFYLAFGVQHSGIV